MKIYLFIIKLKKPIKPKTPKNNTDLYNLEICILYCILYYLL